MARLYKVNEKMETIALKPVYCRDEGKELQELLEKNPDLLCGEQINPEEPRRWILVKREMPVPDPSSGLDRWSIDFFFVDQDGMPTFVECKRYNDTRARREVIGQMLEYAANGQYYWDKEALRKDAENTAQHSGRELEESLISLVGDNSLKVDEFFEKVINNLKEGQVRLIFFLEESPYELRSIADFLNKQMELAEVLIVEARQFNDGVTRFVSPTLFGYTEQARKIKKTLTITTSSQRKKWDEASFFADVEKQVLDSSQRSAVKRIYDFSRKKGAEISWGTGAQRGSFSPKFPQISERSVYSVFSDGALQLNFGWLEGEVAEQYRDALKARISSVQGLSVNDNLRYPSIPVTQWGNVLDEILKILDEVIR